MLFMNKRVFENIVIILQFIPMHSRIALKLNAAL